MQATLVAYYGAKPSALADFIQQVQAKLSLYFSNAFQPHLSESVHGTIIGMEGIPSEGIVLNRFFRDLRGELRPMDLHGALNFIRTTDLLPLQIRIGGFKEKDAYPFTSRAMPPYYRSFSIQDHIAVSIGWPVTSNGVHSSALYQLRKQFQQYNILHRYHRTAGDIDNDLYLVLGRVSAGVQDKTMIEEAESSLRAYIAEMRPHLIPLDRKHLSIVCYTASMLPQTTSVAFQVLDESIDGQLLLQKYV